MHQSILDFIRSLKTSQLLGIVSLLIIIVALPLTVGFLGQKQDTRQRAQTASPFFQYITQSFIAMDGKTGWYRFCPVDPTTGINAPECLSWKGPIDLSNARGIGNESYTAYAAYSFVQNGVQKFDQSLIESNGKTGWHRVCSASYDTGPDFSSCPATWSGSQNNLANIRNTDGKESYIGYGAYSFVKNDLQYVQQSLIETNGTSAWYRTCPIDPALGPNFSACDTWRPVTLANARGTGGNEKYRSYEAFRFTVNGLQKVYQTLLSFDGKILWNRICPIDPQNGPNFTDCTSWTEQNIENVRGIGQESYTAIGSFHFEKISPFPSLTPTVTVSPTQAPTYTISGTVYNDTNPSNGALDPDEQPVGGAKVFINTQEVVTDASGTYELSSLANGTYTIELEVAPGYMTTTDNPVTVSLSQNTTVNFGIAPLPTETPTPSYTPSPTPTATPTTTPEPTLDPCATGLCLTQTPTLPPTIPPTAIPLSSDIDRNGCVGIVDFNIWLSAYHLEIYLQTGTYDVFLDSNRDGQVSTEEITTRSQSLQGTHPDIDDDGIVTLYDFREWAVSRATLPAHQICPSGG